jgi:hypothetical protein
MPTFLAVAREQKFLLDRYEGRGGRLHGENFGRSDTLTLLVRAAEVIA